MKLNYIYSVQFREYILITITGSNERRTTMTKREFVDGMCRQYLAGECDFTYLATIVRLVDEYATECDWDEDFNDFLADTLKLL